MTKTKTIKKVEKVKKDDVVKEQKINNEVKKALYHVFLELNDKTYEVDTDNVEEAILSHKPPVLKTSLTVKVTKGQKTIVRYLYLKDARRLFNNKITLMVFVRNLLF